MPRTPAERAGTQAPKRAGRAAVHLICALSQTMNHKTGLYACIVVLLAYIAFTVRMLVTKRDYFRFMSYYGPRHYSNVLTNHAEPGFTIAKQPPYSGNRNPFISVSIYGTHRKYYDGLNQLIQQVSDHLPGWSVRVYCHNKVSEMYQAQLTTHQHIELFTVHDPLVVPGNSSGAFWRFMPATELGRRFVVLDIDETITPRVLKAIQVWRESKLPYFRFNCGVQNCKYPSNFIWPEDCWCAGRWGCDGTVSIPSQYIQQFPHRTTFGADECWLKFVMSPFSKTHGLCTVYPSKTHHLLSRVHLWKPQTLPKDSVWNIPAGPHKNRDKEDVYIL